ncbi:MAG: SfnB family sulfur acquisition oxidoreductase [Rhodospirillales bacterium]|nr:SfnB family sulfur acquisition oxidoreductase [Rhodospirillales bacterium]
MTTAAQSKTASTRPQEIPASHADARVIRTDGEAIEIAERVAALLAIDASERDRQRILPHREIEIFSNNGLWAITVPKEYGGAGVSHVTLTEVVKIISDADPSLGQMPQNHYCLVDAIRLEGAEAQKRFFFDLLLKGQRFGNAFSETGGKHVLDIQTRLTRDGDAYRLNGRKFYSTGALFAHWVPVWALNDEGQGVLAFVERDAEGLSVIDDWTSFGQRTTASGTVTAEDVRVAADRIIYSHRSFDRPTLAGPLAQIIQAAVDAGIARAAVRETIEFVQKHARPWADSGVEKAAEDPYTIAQIGDLQIRLHAAEALLERSARAIDDAVPAPDEANVAAASVAVAEAKVATTEIAILATNRLFELGGTRSTLTKFNLDRHWRNARTHTLHDPVRWKYQVVGNYYLNGVRPPRHAWL